MKIYPILAVLAKYDYDFLDMLNAPETMNVPTVSRSQVNANDEAAMFRVGPDLQVCEEGIEVLKAKIICRHCGISDSPRKGTTVRWIAAYKKFHVSKYWKGPTSFRFHGWTNWSRMAG